MNYLTQLTRPITHLSIFIILSVFSISTYAESETVDEWLKQAAAIIKSEEKKLKKLTPENVKIETLNESLKEITSIKSQSQSCIAETESQLAKTKEDLNTLGPITKKENPEVSKKRRALTNENKNLEKAIATCKLLQIQSQDLTKAINELQQHYLAKQLSARSTDIIEIIQENLDKPIASWQETVSFIQNQYRLKLLTEKQLGLLITFMFISSLFGIFLKRTLLQQSLDIQLPSDTLSGFTLALRSSLTNVLPIVIPIMVLLVYLGITLPLNPLPLITKTGFVVASYVGLIVFINVLLNPALPARIYLIKHEHLSRQLAWQLKLLLTLGLINFFLSGEYRPGFSEPVYYLSRGILSIFLIINLISILWLVRKFSWPLLSRKPRIFLSLLLISTLFIELAGFRNLSSFILNGLLGTLATLVITLLIYRLLKDLCDGLDEGRLSWEKRFRKSISLKSGDMVPGLIWIRLIIFVVLWGGFVIMVLNIWQLDDPWVTIITSSFTDGFLVGSLTVTPTVIIGGLFSLIVLLSLTRYLKKHVLPNVLKHTRLDRGAKEAVTSLFGYSGVTIAILVALSITGVKMQNIAIIAGALSVGIGFGLQNIVNNFISGLILLFERPIRSGDWIVTGETEGYVKSINIRSTQIQTFDQADVIVPNSELITAKVTNWMLRNNFGRITVAVGVGYDSDVDNVTRILLEIAQNHPMVINEKKIHISEPKVLFRNFGDSALNFELRCFIYDIDQRINVISEINFSIIKAFREENIEIPFPQRVVTLNKSLSDEQDEE